MALIYDNGTVYDYKFQDKKISPQNELLKLPKSNAYYGYTDEKSKTLYFIHDRTRLSITEFDPRTGWHRTIPKSQRKGDWIFLDSIRVGDMFWSFGKLAPFTPLFTLKGTG